MSKRASQAFRPGVESSENRLLTTVLGGAGSMFHAPSAHVRPNLSRAGHPQVAADRGITRAVVAFGGPRGGGGGLGRSNSGYMNWGVISIVNTTHDTITFSVAASTYNFGQFQNFTLRPGGRQAYYAAFGGSLSSQPTFFVSFDTIQHSNPLTVSSVNVVNETPRWVPRVGTEGRPYAIATTGSGYNLVQMF